MANDKVGGTHVEYTADARGAIAGAKQAAGAFEGATKRINSAVKDLDKTERGFSGLEKSVAKLASELKGNGATAQLHMLEMAVEKAGGISKLSGPAFDSVAASIERLTKAGGTAPPVLKQIADGLSHVKEAQAQSQAVMARAAKDYESFQGRVKALTADLSGGKARKEMAELAIAVEKAGGVSALSAPKLEQVRKAVAALAAEGAKPHTSLASIVPAGPSAKEKAGQALQGLATDKLQGLAGEIGPLGSVLTSIGSGGMVAAAGLGAAAVAGGALVVASKAALDYAGSIKDLNARNDVGTDALQRFGVTAKLANGDLGVLTGAMNSLDKAIQNKPALIEDMGLSLERVRAAAPEERLLAVGNAVAAMADPVERNNAALEIFGKKWSELKPMLAGLREGAGDKAAALGIVMPESEIERLDRMGDSLTMLGETWSGFQRNIGAAATSILPIQGAIEGVTSVVGALSRALQDPGLKTGLLLFAANPIVGTALAIEKSQKAKVAVAEQEALATVAALRQGGKLSPQITMGPAMGDVASRESAKLEQEYQQALAGTMGGLAATTQSINANTTAKRAEIEASKELTRAEKEVLLAAVDKVAKAQLSAAASQHEQQVRQQVLALEREYQAAVAGTATGLDGAIAKIQASAAAKREEIGLNRDLTASERERQQAIVSATEQIQIQVAQSAAARQTATEASAQYAAAERLANETLEAGLSPLEVKIRQLDAQKFAEIDAAQAVFVKAQMEGRETEELRKGVNARIAAANARAKGAVELAKETEALQVNAASTALVDKAQQQYAASLARGNDSLRQQVGAIYAKRDADINAAEAQFKSGKITAEALSEATRLYNLTAEAAIRYARVANVAAKIQGVGNVVNAGGGLAQELGASGEMMNAIGGVEQQIAGGQQLAMGYATGNPMQMAAGAMQGLTGQIKLYKAIHGMFTDSGAEKAIKDVGRRWGVKLSEGLAEQIDKDAKKTGDRYAATLLNLPALFKEAGGVERFGAENAAHATRDLFVQLETGKLTLEQVGDTFEEVFGDLAAAHISKTTGMASAQLLELVELAKRFGVESPALREFLKGQNNQLIGNLTGGVSGMKGLRDTIGGNAGRDASRVTRNSLKDSGLSEEEIEERVRRAGNVAAGAAAGAVGIVSQAAATALGTSVVAAYNTAIEQGMTRGEALQAIKPLVESMREELSAAGFEGGAAFGALEEQIRIASDEITGPMLSGIGSLTGALVNMHNMGMLNQSTFSGITEQIGANIAALEAQGVTGPALLQALQPDLQKLYEMQTDYGYAVDAATQARIDEAKAAGLVGEEHRSAADKMLIATERMVEALEYLAQQAGYTGSKLDQMARPRTLKLTVEEEHRRSTTPPTTGTSLGGPAPTVPDPLPENAEGGVFRYRPGGHIGIFGEREDEYAVPASSASSFARAILGNMSFTPVGNVGGTAAGLPSAAAVSAGVSRSMAGAAGGSGMSVTSPVTIAPGAIVINGATDPKATAAAVASALRDNHAVELERQLRARGII